MRTPCRRREHRWRVAAQAALPAEPLQKRQENEPLRSRSLRLAKHPHYTGAADKTANLVGCKSPHHQLPGRVVSMSDACGGNEACSART